MINTCLQLAKIRFYSLLQVGANLAEYLQAAVTCGEGSELDDCAGRTQPVAFTLRGGLEGVYICTLTSTKAHVQSEEMK